VAAADGDGRPQRLRSRRTSLRSTASSGSGWRAETGIKMFSEFIERISKK
jgi:hypothetical protein